MLLFKVDAIELLQLLIVVLIRDSKIEQHIDLQHYAAHNIEDIYVYFCEYFPVSQIIKYQPASNIKK